MSVVQQWMLAKPAMGETALYRQTFTDWLGTTQKGADANPTEASPVPEQQNEILEVKEAVQIDLGLKQQNCGFPST